MMAGNINIVITIINHKLKIDRASIILVIYTSYLNKLT